MTLKFKLLAILPSISIGGLVFIGFIAYQSGTNFATVKQQELLRDFSLQILSNRPQSSTSALHWKHWIESNPLIHNSSFLSFLMNANGKPLVYSNGNKSLADTDFGLSLAQTKNLNSLREHYVSHHGLIYTWYDKQIPHTPYSLLMLYASKPEEISFYLKYMGTPLIIAAIIVLWVSVWLSMILSHLYKRLDSQKKQMEHNALHDALTGLPNRTLLTSHIKQVLEEAEQKDSSFALMMIDLNRFKEINDALGHNYGDILLIEVAKRLRNTLRSPDIVARLGGDEFMVILQHAYMKRAKTVAERISQCLKSEFYIDDKAFHISGSIGIALYPEHAKDIDQLMKCADLTMYRAKHLNRDYEFFNFDSKQENSNNLFLFTELVHAIKENHFEIYYQPKLDTRLGKVTGMEALIRWNHPNQGYIAPNIFIPIAEVTGLIRDLSPIVIEQVIKDQVQLRRMGIDIDVSINLSARDLDDDTICDFMQKMVSKYSAIPENIVLEITESAMMFNTEQTGIILNTLRGNGYKISIDDFGTGYSSLSNLQKMQIEEIKIDKTFVINMDSNENNNRIVRGTISLAHDLGIRVVAEGAETEAIIGLLKSLDCDMIQGYGICPPQPLFDVVQKYWHKTLPQAVSS